MKIRIWALAMGLVLSFVAGRMSSQPQPVEPRSMAIEARVTAAASEPPIVPACEQVCDTLPAAEAGVSDFAWRSTPALEQALDALDAARIGDDEYSQLHALRHLWVLAADEGVPSDALHALESIRDAPQVDARVEHEADLALEDLDRLIRSTESTTVSPVWEPEAAEPFDFEHAMARKPRLQPDPRDLEADAMLFDRFSINLDDPEPAVRLDTVRGLARHRREEVAPLLLRAVHDRDTGVRLATIRSLWVVAADGFDRDGEIVRSLEYASRDRDDRVRTLAMQALVDLESVGIF